MLTGCLSLIGKKKTSFLIVLALGLKNQYQNKVFNQKLGEWSQWLTEANDMFKGTNDNISSIVCEVIETVVFFSKTYFKPKIHKTITSN